MELEERILRAEIGESTAGRTVRQFLMQEFSLQPRQISRLKFKPQGICVNGERAYVTRRLEAGDVLEVRLTPEKQPRDTRGARDPKIWEAPPEWLSAYPLRILYEDRDLLIVDKPAGIVSHPSPGHYADTLANQAAAYLGVCGTAAQIRVTGRLDRETSGIVTLAKNAETAALVQRQRQEGQLVKEYLALVEGVPVPPEGTVDLPLRREYPGSFKMTAAQDGKPAQTIYRTLQKREQEKRALLLCTIRHGRTHQIRVHLASIGHPIAGDPLYGTPEKGDTGLCLHAYHLTMKQPFTGENIDVYAQPPGWTGVSGKGPKNSTIFSGIRENS